MRTHYDVLNLDKNCTAKEIKDSFIKLSKKYHPDKNDGFDAHQKFVEVNEAYSVLGKTHTRSSYDASLSYGGPGNKYRVEHSGGTFNGNIFRPKNYDDYAKMYAKQRQNYRETGTFPAMTKIKSIFLCCILIFIGSAIHIKASLNRRSVRSQQIAAILKENKDRTQRLGKKQILLEMEEAVQQNAKANAPK